MGFEEIKINEIYEVEGLVHHVVHKHNESKTVFTLAVGSDEPYGWTEDDLHLFSPIALPETGLLVSKSGSIIYRTGERSGYGFALGRGWYDNDDWGEFTSYHWKKATPEDELEFEKLLIKEAAKYGLVDGVEFESPFSGNKCVVNTKDTRFNCAGFTMGTAYVFYKGKWATPIKNEKQDELDESIKYMLSLAKKLGIDITLIIDGKKKKS